jgi:hypothetical protein
MFWSNILFPSSGPKSKPSKKPARRMLQVEPMKTTIVWYATMCSLLRVQEYIRGIYCFYVQGQRLSQERSRQQAYFCGIPFLFGLTALQQLILVRFENKSGKGIWPYGHIWLISMSFYIYVNCFTDACVAHIPADVCVLSFSKQRFT